MFVPPRKRRCLLAIVQQQQQQPHRVSSSDQQPADLEPPQLRVDGHPDCEGASSTQQQMLQQPTDQAQPAQFSPLFRVQGKKSHQCRTCGLQLSSASNRLRHERAKHKPTAAGSQSGLAAGTVAAAAAGEAAELECDPPNSDADHDSDSELLADHDSDKLAMASALAFSTEVEGYRPMLQESELQASCFSFLQWLSLPPLTACEALVKARRVKSLTQLQPIKSNLRFIFAVLHEKELIQSVDLADLSKLAICQSLFEALGQRNVGSGRFHAVFLLVKKVLVYLTSQESTLRRQFLQPTMHESFMYVDSICSDNSYRRKQEARNRAVLGVQASQTLARGQQQRAPEAFQVPIVWSSAPAAATTNSSKPPQAVHVAQICPASSQSLASASAAAPASAAARVVEAVVSAPELTKTELQQVAQGCLSYLKSSLEAAEAAAQSAAAANAEAPASGTNRANLDRLFMAHLVTATLCLGLAPRSQVLKQMRLGSSFIKEAADGLYWVKMLADMSKNGKPTTFAIPAQLTPAFDFYLETIRPRLVGQLQQPEKIHDYIFVKHNGSAPRSDFSSCTNLVTQRLIGRPINAHAFRAAVITAYYEAGASQSEMDTLASIMAHDPATARNFYFRPQFNQAALQANEKMTELLLQ